MGCGFSVRIARSRPEHPAYAAFYPLPAVFYLLPKADRVRVAFLFFSPFGYPRALLQLSSRFGLLFSFGFRQVIGVKDDPDH